MTELIPSLRLAEHWISAPLEERAERGLRWLTGNVPTACLLVKPLIDEGWAATQNAAKGVLREPKAIASIETEVALPQLGFGPQQARMVDAGLNPETANRVATCCMILRGCALAVTVPRHDRSSSQTTRFHAIEHRAAHQAAAEMLTRHAAVLLGLAVVADLQGWLTLCKVVHETKLMTADSLSISAARGITAIIEAVGNRPTSEYENTAQRMISPFSG